METLLLLLCPLPLTVVLARCLQRAMPWGILARTYRTAVVVSAGLTTVVRPWLHSRHPAWLPSMSLCVIAATVGGVVATSIAIGLAEDNSPPPPGVRDKVLEYHRSSVLRYPPAPRVKRAMDATLALFGILVTLPLWFVIAFAVWFEDPGPIFFIKNSVGRGGITFRQVKFRSMQYNAERMTGPVASSRDDPRRLWCGKAMRRWHLDELPELINVLGGSMSMVGPRPLRTVQVQRYLEELPEFAERHAVKPGIACIAQIEKYHLSAAERLRKDQAYIRKMSVGLDLRLLVRAVRTTLLGARENT